MTKPLNGLYAVGHHERSVSVSAYLFSTDDFTEELLNLHEAEVKTLKKYYEDHRELFEGVTKWQENWTVYLELDVSAILMNLVGKHLKQTSSLGVVGCVCECMFFPSQKKANDPSRFNNRGGNLLKEEKQRTDLQKSLPKVRKCLKVMFINMFCGFSKYKKQDCYSIVFLLVMEAVSGDLKGGKKVKSDFLAVKQISSSKPY